jgi:hypothetical protein
MNNPAAIISIVDAFIIRFIFDPRKAKIYFITSHLEYTYCSKHER